MPSLSSALDAAESAMPVPEPPRAVESHCFSTDSNVLPPICAVLENLLSISRLRGHAQLAAEADSLRCSDLSSPAALLSVMNERLSVASSYLLELPCVQNALPPGCDAEFAAGLVAAAARMSSRLALLQTPHGGEARVAILPHAAPRSRCTLHIQNISAAVTVAHIQRAIPRHSVFHVCRPSSDSAFVTFEDAHTAKSAFVDLQKKPIGGCTTAQVKMRVESDTQLFGAPRPNNNNNHNNNISHNNHSHKSNNNNNNNNMMMMMAMPREHGMHHTRMHGAAPRAIGEVDATCSAFSAAHAPALRHLPLAAPAPVAPIDAHLTSNIKAGKLFVRVPGSGGGGCGHASAAAAARGNAQPRAARWRGEMQRGMYAAMMRDQIMLATHTRPMWETNAVSGNAGGNGPNIYGSLSGMRPPFPVDAAAAVPNWMPFAAAAPAPHNSNSNSNSSFSAVNASVAASASDSVVRRRRLQHDPYKGDIYFESVVSGAATQEEEQRQQQQQQQIIQPPPKHVLDRKMRSLHCLGLSAAPLKETGNSSDEEDRSADLTPNETSSNSPSDGSENCGTRHLTYAEVTRAARVAECPMQTTSSCTH